MNGDVGESPEDAYRRGYQQGAHDAIEALAAASEPTMVERAREWAGVAIAKWRFAADRSDRAARPPKAPAQIRTGH